jgi:hypothetical protein
MQKVLAVVALYVLAILAFLASGLNSASGKAGSTAFMVASILLLLFADMLSGCASVEGDGYANGRGYASQRLCVRTDKRGNQVWFNCK